MIKKELKFANLTFTMQVRHVFQVLPGVISEFYVLFPGSMLNHRPVCCCKFAKNNDLYIINVDLVNANEYTNLVLFCQFILKILSKNKILTSIKGRNSVVNVDLVNDNEYTKFGLNLFFRSQDMEQKRNSDVNQGP